MISSSVDFVNRVKMDTFLFSLLVLGCLYISSNGESTDLPAGIQKCSISDVNCLKEGMNYVLKTYAKTGIEELGLVKLDPLAIKKFGLGKKPNSPVSIDMTFQNAELIGLSNAQIKKVTAFSYDLSRPVIFEMFIPKVITRGPYSINGHVMILPIVGKGQAEIVLENLKTRAVVKMKAESKDSGHTYANVVDVKLELEPSRVRYKLDGLFDGQKELSDNLHQLVNDNWRDIFNELKGDIAIAMGRVFKTVLNKTIGKRPLQELFSD